MNKLLYIVSICFFVFVPTIFSQTPSEVKIGNQIWTTKNLDVSTFRNGEAIPEAKNAEEWAKAGENKTAAYCYYDYDSKNGKVYGKLYNWYAVNDSRGLAPKGYHIPSDAEWTILTDMLGGEAIAGEKLKSKQGWKKNGKKSGSGNNSSGFNGLPGGLWYYNGSYDNVTEGGDFWSSSEFDTNNTWSRGLHYMINPKVYRACRFKGLGLSVRCLKD